jgi:hypothetical protein
LIWVELKTYPPSPPFVFDEMGGGGKEKDFGRVAHLEGLDSDTISMLSPARRKNQISAGLRTLGETRVFGSLCLTPLGEKVGATAKETRKAGSYGERPRQAARYEQ